MNAKALRLGENRSRIIGTNLSSFNFSKGITLELWARREGRGNVGSRGIVITTGYWYIDFYNDTHYLFSAYINGRQYTWQRERSIPDNEWVHLAVTYDRQTIRFYENGDLLGEVNISGYITTSRFYVGGYNTGTDYTFIGSVKGIRVFNLAKTGQQIKEDMYMLLPKYNEGLVLNYPLEEGEGNVATDYSPYRHNGEILYGTWTDDGIRLLPPIELIFKERDIIVPRGVNYQFNYEIRDNRAGYVDTREYDPVLNLKVGNMIFKEFDLDASKWLKMEKLRVN